MVLPTSRSLSWLCRAWVVMVCLSGIHGDGTLFIRQDSYVNPGGKGDNGNCCDGMGFICTGDCDHYFEVCIDQPGSETDDMDVCPLGSYQTDAIREQNSITFGNSIGATPNPKPVNFHGAWLGGAKVKMNVWDDDSRNDNDFVEFLSVAFYISPSGTWQELELSGRTTLTMSVRVECASEWFGPLCDVHCVDGLSYTCDVTSGQKICVAGWAGSECNQNIDECANAPCQNGRCEDLVNGYICHCDLGYAGENCERVASACSDSPCHESATCTDTEDTYTCYCAPGFTGLRCDEPLVSCDRCQNGGVCQSRGDDVSCLCVDGWTGDDCSEAVNECLSNPCPEHKICNDLVGGFICNCPAGWKGDDCAENIDECIVHQCAEGATCVDGINTYRCDCPSGRYGTFCIETTCGGHVCRNGGQCETVGGALQCACAAGYEGADCSVFTLCVEEPCLNGGSCAPQPTVERWCSCPPDFEGERCEHPVMLENFTNIFDTSIQPCFNQGLLQMDGTCLCSWQHFGDICEHTLPVCSSWTSGDSGVELICVPISDTRVNGSVCWLRSSQLLGLTNKAMQCHTVDVCGCGSPCFYDGQAMSCDPVQPDHVFLEFYVELTKQDMEDFLLDLHRSTSAALGLPRHNISVFHRQYVCKADKTSTSYTALAVDLFDYEGSLGAADTVLSLDVAAMTLNTTRLAFQRADELDHARCQLTYATGASSGEQSASGLNRKAPFYFIVAGSLLAVIALILGLMYWRHQRQTAYPLLRNHEAGGDKTNRLSQRPMLYEPMEEGTRHNRLSQRYSNMSYDSSYNPRHSRLSYR